MKKDYFRLDKGKNFFDAIYNDDKAKVEQLLEKDESLLNSLNINNYTPHHFASLIGKYDMIELLLNRGVDIDSLDKHGKAMLHYAVNNKNMEIVNLLIERNATVDIVTRTSKETPFTIAVAQGWLEGLKRLVEVGANPKLSIHDLIELASRHLRGVEIIQLLIDHGIKPTQYHQKNMSYPFSVKEVIAEYFKKNPATTQ